MNKFNEVLKIIYSKDNWKNEDEFLTDILFSSSITIINKCYAELDKGETIVLIPPLLRQVQENIVVLLGLLSEKYTIQEFIKDGNKPKTIIKRIKESEKEEHHPMIDAFSNLLQDLKDELSNYTHTSFNGAMSLFTDRFHTPETKQFNKSSMLILIHFIEALIVAFLNLYYGLEVEPPNPKLIAIEFKKVKTLKYAMNNMPEPIMRFIKDSEHLITYYRNADIEFKKRIKEIQDINILNS